MFPLLAIVPEREHLHNRTDNKKKSAEISTSEEGNNSLI
jgi:hypothetical protein